MCEFEDELSNLAYLSSLAGPPSNSLPEERPKNESLPEANAEALVPTKVVRQERAEIKKALQDIGTPPERIEAIMGPESPYIRKSWPVPVFRVPPFHASNQTLSEWITQAEKAWAKHRDQFIAKLQLRVEAPFNEKQQRGPGKKEVNADVNLRYKFAAHYLTGEQWIAIAERYYPDQPRARAADRIRHITIRVLDQAMLRRPSTGHKSR